MQQIEGTPDAYGHRAVITPTSTSLARSIFIVRSMRPSGFFITFEGSEGCGKSTQIKRLAARLEGLERPIVLAREPGGTEIGEAIRELLQFSKAGHAMTPEAELLLFTASRAQLVREIIEPALALGAIVIADRFFDSTTVYQGVARRLDPAAVKTINEFAVGALRPDITFVLDLEVDTARARMLSRTQAARRGEDRMEQEPLTFYDAVRAGYLALAETEGERIQVLDGAIAPDELETKIWAQLAPRLLL